MKQIKQDKQVNSLNIKLDDITLSQLRKIKQHYGFTTTSEVIRALIKKGSMNL